MGLARVPPYPSHCTLAYIMFFVVEHLPNTRGTNGEGDRRPDVVLQELIYPRTLILEKESTARDEMGCPIDIAGRKVVKINILFTCGKSS